MRPGCLVCAYITVIREDAVAIIETARMHVKHLRAGRQPWGLIVMSPPGPGSARAAY